MEKWMLIDGNSIAYRAFFAMPPLTNAAGLHTNAVFGFTNMLMKLIAEEKPTHILVAFDAGKINFRHANFGDYKAGRAKTPPELREQFPLIHELIDAFGIAQFEIDGYEADDIIGTLTRMADERAVETIVISGDKDMLQLASAHVTIGLTRKGVSELDRYQPAEIAEKYGLQPLQIIDLKGLMGDPSDNIPGIPGVGEKTALKLLHEFGSVEEVLARSSELKGKMKEKVEANKESAQMSKQLATIFRDVPLEHDASSIAYNGYDVATLTETFRKLGFKSLMEKIQPAAVDIPSISPASASFEMTVIDEQLSRDELEQALAGVECVYIETAGENAHHAELLGLAITAGERIFVATKDTLLGEVGAPLRAWLEDDNAPKQGWDLHKVQLTLAWHGIAMKGMSFDVLLAAYLLDPADFSQTLDTLVTKYELPAIASEEAVFGKGAKFKVPSDERLTHYLAERAHALQQLVPLQYAQIEQNDMSKLFFELELPLSGVLATMELQGILVNAQTLGEIGTQLTGKIDDLVQSIYSHAGTEFNINSTKQLGEILFDRLGLPVIKKTKTGYSTDAEVLEKLEPYHDIVKQILQYRQLAKLQSTYIEGLLKEIRPTTGKVHTYYRQMIAATGRLSSQFPNLQNIPIRMEEGRRIRKAFEPAEPGWTILAADYSQIELRVLAHISGDDKLKEAFIHNMDIHTKTAMDVFGVTAEQVDANMRRQAKAVNFGIVYGISDFGLSNNLGITRKEAASFIEQYFAVFQGVRKYMDDIVAQAKQAGYVTTLLERRRYLPDIRSSNFNLRSFAERTAMNTPIQGTAADIIKLAMVRMDEQLRARGLRSRMLLQVHDELVFEVPPEELPLMQTLVPEVMEQALKLDVPLKADVSFGANWYEAK